jgi:hypothetical protein
LFNTYGKFIKLLEELKFSEFYLEEISNRAYRLDYGKQKGIIDFGSIKESSKKYTYNSSERYAVNIDSQLLILNDPVSLDENELILQCIEVFDWGGVQTSNIINAIILHRNQRLKHYLLKCKDWFENDDILDIFDINDCDITWSSGWTKVYSFMFSKTTIYDSRVAAFINFMLITFYHTLNSEEEREDLKSISSKLVSFNGTANRKRSVSAIDRKLLGMKIKSGNDKNNFVANKVASWLLRYISDLEFSSQEQNYFRQIDKAAFMLGFDISQIEPELNFK